MSENEKPSPADREEEFVPSGEVGEAVERTK